MKTQPEKAGEITGMLLTLTVDELNSLLDSEPKLRDKVQEAFEVLKQIQMRVTKLKVLLNSELTWKDKFQEAIEVLEAVYPLVMQIQPEKAGKITGILQE